MSQTEFETFQETFLAKQKNTTAGKWFGFSSLNLNGKPFAASYEGQLVLKLGAETIATLFSRYPGSKLFDPSGMNRAMKDWLQIPTEFSGDWLELAQKALSFAASQAPKKTKIVKPSAKAPKKAAKKKNLVPVKKKTLQKKKSVAAPASKKKIGSVSKKKVAKKKTAPKKKRK
ncbi:DUF773 domain-containing protein [Leptospira ellisii]|uniref:DUF773 domain-containing protein n=1 Tax=Leptospira ellisii TaxID=2023197 RepID=A0A2N0B7F0_9LEPT|nr:DUF773 domain-containing protein [Leptospira ellisii]MDV6235713.1 DUF773 domain-containing protein [Leptospira ellisii]PJZ92477.1 DUF773 domain-containing protein [Leptospira ellisii]PKA03919.1 DUF773 domain-containing protein [Leptospira ellisii]